MKLSELIRKDLDLLNNAILLESAKDRYIQMFLPLEQWDNVTINRINTNITHAIQVYKKEDRIIWYLRTLKYEILSKIPNPDLTPKQQQWLDKNKYYENSNINKIKENLDHFLSLSIPKIQSTVFSNQTPNDLFDLFKEYEDDYLYDQVKDSDRRYIIEDENTTNIIVFPDGSKWVNLNRPYCRNEADTMGHCGNAPQSNNMNQTILSYRTPFKDGWIPHLTFIYTIDQGSLGEMKGYANQKPSKKYHPYIIKLLMHPMIKDIKGGGYKPENNFSITDLNQEQQELLVNHNPLFASFDYLLKAQKLDTLKQKVINLLSTQEKYTSLMNILEYDDDIGFKLHTINKYPYPDLLDELNISSRDYSLVTTIAETLEEGHLEYHIETTVDDLINVFDSLDDHTQTTIREKWYNQYKIPEDVNIVEYVYDEYQTDDEIIDLLFRSYEAGFEAGSLKEYDKAFNEWIYKLNLYICDNYGYPIISIPIQLIDMDDKYVWYIDKRNFSSLRYFQDWKLLYESDEEVWSIQIDTYETKDIIEPYSGFAEYDEESAIEYFKDFY